MKKVKRHSKIRLWATHTSTTVSITLVLFMLGLIMMLGYHSYRAIYDMQENITYRVELSPEMDAEHINALQKMIQQKDYVKQVDYISMDEAAEIFSENLDEDFLGFCNGNPLFPSFMVNFRPDLIPDSSCTLVEQFRDEMFAVNGVEAVDYQENVVGELYDVFYKAEYFLIIFSALLIIISIMLISSTIRISLYSQHETLQTMRMVGAKKSFIRRPFLSRGVFYGAMGGVLAILFILVAVIAFDNQFSLNLLDEKHYMWYGGIGAILILIGMIITWIATILALNKHLKEN